MKHPLWLLNSILLFILIIVVGFIVFMRPRAVYLEPYEPVDSEIKPHKRTLPKIDLAVIYSDDLFNTYKAPVAPAQPEQVPAVPQPPAIRPSRPSVPPTPKLLDPLNVSLKGIMITGDDATNIAVIENEQTNISKNYKVGDKIEDAQLIRIMKNKISIVRSNGQQETLYVSQHDAEINQLVSPQPNWTAAVSQTNEAHYTIDPNIFITKVRNLAQFIDLLNLTTVYKQGQSVGCRVGRIQSNSLATALGLQTGDIITRVADIPATDTDSRYTIYQKVTGLQLGDTLQVTMQRGDETQTITYTLKEIDILDQKPGKETIDQIVYPEKTMEDVEAEKQRIMHERHRFAPTARQIEQQQKRVMLQKKQRGYRQRKRNVLTEQLEL